MVQKPDKGNPGVRIPMMSATCSGIFRIFGTRLAGGASSAAYQAAASTRCRSRSGLARPYIMRLSILSRLICPSTGLVLHGSTSAAQTAA